MIFCILKYLRPKIEGTSIKNIHIGNIKEIDGLRGVAVLSVILYHIKFGVSGGFLGVDIFFVISGYLITRIVYLEILGNKFSILTFWERRLRRILPMLIFVLSFIYLFGFLILERSNLRDLNESLILSLFSISNVYFYFKINYFSNDQSLVPLLHTWSLGIEEQFYLFFPFLMLAIYRFYKNRINRALVILFLFSLSLNLLTSFRNQDASFYLLPFRAYELLLGSILFLNANKLKIHRLNYFKSHYIGTVLIILPIIFYDSIIKYFGAFVETPRILLLLGVTLIILNLRENNSINRILRQKFMVIIGLSSYSSYLLHQPITSLVRNYTKIELSIFLKVAIFTIVIMMSLFTFKYIERPFRQKDFLTRKNIFTLSLFSVIILTTGSYQTLRILNYESFPRIERKLAAELISSNKNVFFDNVDERIFVKELIKVENRNIKNVVIGSSRIMQISNSNEKSPTLNLGVSGASLEDLVAISDLAVSRFNPETLVIGLDPWLINDNSGQTRWLSIDSDYYTAQDKLNKFKLTTSKETLVEKSNQNEVPPLGYSFALNLYSKYNYSFNKSYISNLSTPELLAKKRRDGTHIYGINYLEDQKALNPINISATYNYGMNDFSTTKNLLSEMEAFIKFYSQKTQIVLFLTPYLYQEEPSNVNYSLIQEIEEKYIKIANDLNVEIIGSFDSRKLNCNMADFYDGFHAKPSCLTKLPINWSD